MVVPMNNMAQNNGYEAVVQLMRDEPQWVPVVMAALDEAKTNRIGRFAGAWVMEKAKTYGVRWIPNFRKLVAYGILKKEGESSRGGRRSYYSMPDIEGVERALMEWRHQTRGEHLYPAHAVTGAGIARKQTASVPMFANLASCGSPNLSEGHVDDYLEIDTALAKPGHQYFIVRADGESMNQAGINNGDLVLVRVQNHADIGQKVVVSLEDGATIKELQYQDEHMVLVPRSSDPQYKAIVLTAGAEIQGVVVATLPNIQ